MSRQLADASTRPVHALRSFLRKNLHGNIFSAEKGNLYAKHSYKCSGARARSLARGAVCSRKYLLAAAMSRMAPLSGEEGAARGAASGSRRTLTLELQPSGPVAGVASVCGVCYLIQREDSSRSGGCGGGRSGSSVSARVISRLQWGQLRQCCVRHPPGHAPTPAPFTPPGIANDKAVDIREGANGGVDITVKRAKTAGKPAASVAKATSKKGARRSISAIRKQVGSYRKDLTVRGGEETRRRRGAGAR